MLIRQETKKASSVTSQEVQEKTGKRRFRRRVFLVLFGLAAVLLLSPWIWRQAVRLYYGAQINSVETTEPMSTAIVFGAAVYGDGRLSTVLRDRMDTAIALYESGKVNRILVSGDNRVDHYNEPGAMMAYAIRQGVPADDVQPDYAGLRTYDTCYRARHIFQLESALLVTQEFHLPRAIFTCRQLGIDGAGVSADRRRYRAGRWYEFRETVATARALWDVLRQEPAQVLGETIPLP